MTAPQGWEDYVGRWAGQKPPLRPHPDCVVAMATSVAGSQGPALLLGVTPELANIGTDLTAIDWAQSAITDIWPGDTAYRRAMLGDWQAMPFGDGAFACAIGDGSLNTLEWPVSCARVITELARVVRSGGRVALRAFVAPDIPESPEDIRADVFDGRETSFAATKWRLAMALTDADHNVAVAQVFAVFQDLFPDRDLLSCATRWTPETIAEIDAYHGSATRLAFPTRAAFEAIVAPSFTARWIDAGDYPLAARCPILVLTR